MVGGLAGLKAWQCEGEGQLGLFWVCEKKSEPFQRGKAEESEVL